MKAKELVSFYDGLIYIDNLQCMMFPMNFFLTICNEIFAHEKEKNISQNLNSMLKVDAYLLAKKYQNKNKKITLIKSISTFNKLGMGEIKLVVFQNKIVFSMEKDILSQYYEKLYSKNKKEVFKEIPKGFLKNLLRYIFQKNINCDIIIKDKIYFICSFENSFEKNDEIIENYEYPKEKKVTSLLKKVLVNDHLKISNGKVNLWGVSAIFVPFHMIFRLLKNSDNSYADFLKSLGKLQGKCAVELQQQKFGILNKEIFYEVVKQSSLIGMGKFEIKQKDPLSFMIVNNLESHYKNYYQKKIIDSIRDYLIYDIKGIYDFINEKNSKIIETEVISLLPIEKEILSPKEKELILFTNVKALFLLK